MSGRHMDSMHTAGVRFFLFVRADFADQRGCNYTDAEKRNRLRFWPTCHAGAFVALAWGVTIQLFNVCLDAIY